MLKRRKSANTKALHNKYGPKFAIKNRKLKENRGNAKGADKRIWNENEKQELQQNPLPNQYPSPNQRSCQNQKPNKTNVLYQSNLSHKTNTSHQRSYLR